MCMCYRTLVVDSRVASRWSGEMGLLKAIHRRSWKNAVGTEFFNQHGVHLHTFADLIGSAAMDDLLNDE
jgi:hypothetical protein